MGNTHWLSPTDTSHLERNVNLPAVKVYRLRYYTEITSIWTKSLPGVRGKHLYKRHPFYLGIASFGGLGGVGSEGCKGFPYGLGQTFLWTFSKLSESKNACQDGLWGKKVPLSAPKCPNDKGAMVKSNLRNAQKAGATFMMVALQLLTFVVYSYKQG